MFNLKLNNMKHKTIIARRERALTNAARHNSYANKIARQKKGNFSGSSPFSLRDGEGLRNIKNETTNGLRLEKSYLIRSIHCGVNNGLETRYVCNAMRNHLTICKELKKRKENSVLRLQAVTSLVLISIIVLSVIF